MTFEKEKREVRRTPSCTSLSIYRLCVLSSLFLVACYFSYLLGISVLSIRPVNSSAPAPMANTGT